MDIKVKGQNKTNSLTSKKGPGKDPGNSKQNDVFDIMDK